MLGDKGVALGALELSFPHLRQAGRMGHAGRVGEPVDTRLGRGVLGDRVPEEAETLVASPLEDTDQIYVDDLTH